MTERQTRASRRNTPINSQPRCEDAYDMAHTPAQIPLQGISPPYTRGSIHGHDSETNANDVRMSDPMFQMPGPAYGTSDSAFSAGLLDQAAFSQFLDEIKSAFMYDCATILYAWSMKDFGNTDEKTMLLCYMTSMFQSNLNRRSASHIGTADNQPVGNEGDRVMQ
ncbi:hypothetical protein N7523_005581 [Penicillium sp. IBT 18751x]|nr:hypothetical protein N7523_005832 [Penicillium sp. IBT 18751x]KAJ6117830.1 hypothetical protein N7523_005581 [Penicillium sp. IBT 18751x]